jgi:hypothetical protein
MMEGRQTNVVDRTAADSSRAPPAEEAKTWGTLGSTGSLRDQTGNRFGDRCVPKVLQKRLSAPHKSLKVKALRLA